MSHLYRCQNCGEVFRSERSHEAPRPACKCGVNPDAEPELGIYIQALETIHFDPPHPVVKNRGKGHLACTPAVRVAGKRATAEPAVVNCDDCRRTEVWKIAYGLVGEPAVPRAHDEVIETDKATIG